MTASTADGTAAPAPSPAPGLYVVRVVDNVDEQIAGHGSRA
jgi:hypothetical protein